MASSARKRDRGATFVEYALVVAVFTTVLVGAFDVLTRSAGDELASTGDSIGTPYIGTSAGATSTSVPAGPGGSPTTTTPATSTTLSPTTTIPPTTTTVAPTTTTVAPTTTTVRPTTTTTQAPRATASCSGRNCTVTATGPPGSTYSWTIQPGDLSGTGATINQSVPSGYGGTFTITYTIRPSNQQVTARVWCPASSGACSVL
ncbi:MAG TPA: hypothetical protein VIR58_01620 [Acidimicrobiales bacterium]